MAVDVITEIPIDQPVDVVAAYAGDPTNAPEWYANIESVVWQTEPPVSVGSRMDFVDCSSRADPPATRGRHAAKGF